MKKIVLLFILALLIRGALIGIWYQTGQGNRVSDDGTGYYDLAKNLSEGKGFASYGVATTHRPPIYPLFIAFFLMVGASFPLSVQVAQAFVGAASCVILFAIGRHVFSEEVGIVASVIHSLDYASVRETVAVMPETLFVFFLLASFYFLLRGEEEKRVRWFMGAGLLGGLSLLTREVTLLFFPLIVFWIFILRWPWRTRFLCVGTFLASLCLTLAPWVIRNSLLYGKPVLVTTRAGHTFYLANNPRATGGRTGGDWDYRYDSFFPSDPNFPPFESVEANHYLFKEGLRFIRTQPGKFLHLVFRKMVNMWRPYQTDSPRLAQWTMGVTYVPVIIFGLIGIFLTRRRWREMFPLYSFIAYIFVLHSLLIAQIRYRFPVMPLFMIFAAFAMVLLWEKWRLRYANPISE